MNRTLIAQTAQNIGQTVTINGWARRIRQHKSVIFWDVRDVSGSVQVVLTSDTTGWETAADVREEWIVAVTGTINKRPENLVNDKLATGHIELAATEFTVISRAATPPFTLDDTTGVNEELRLAYRYLDLRSDRLQKNLTLRHQVNLFMRNYLTEEGFREIETPLLTKSTPEGARDFVVPARKYPSMFYALPQSPQQYKQLLMVGGIERYFQITRCFRDEDQRGERQPEFTQLDVEMSFVEQEDILNLIEGLLIALVKEVTPEKKIQQIPFPRLSYSEAMEKYHSDKPDVRTDPSDLNSLAFCWVVDFPMFEYKPGDKRWATAHNPFTMPKAEHHQIIRDIVDKKRPLEDLALVFADQYDLALNGHEIFGGAVRNHQPDLLSTVFQAIGHSKESVQEQFGHMLEAFSFGVPPHAGIASGQDRLLMILAGEPTIREVIPFPKNGEAYDPLMHSPAPISTEQLRELGLTTTKKEQ